MAKGIFASLEDLEDTGLVVEPVDPMEYQQAQDELTEHSRELDELHETYNNADQDSEVIEAVSNSLPDDDTVPVESTIIATEAIIKRLGLSTYSLEAYKTQSNHSLRLSLEETVEKTNEAKKSLFKRIWEKILEFFKKAYDFIRGLFKKKTEATKKKVDDLKVDTMANGLIEIVDEIYEKKSNTNNPKTKDEILQEVLKKLNIKTETRVRSYGSDLHNLVLEGPLSLGKDLAKFLRYHPDEGRLFFHSATLEQELYLYSEIRLSSDYNMLEDLAELTGEMGKKWEDIKKQIDKLNDKIKSGITNMTLDEEKDNEIKEEVDKTTKAVFPAGSKKELKSIMDKIQYGEKRLEKLSKYFTEILKEKLNPYYIETHIVHDGTDRGIIRKEITKTTMDLAKLIRREIDYTTQLFNTSIRYVDFMEGKLKKVENI